MKTRGVSGAATAGLFIVGLLIGVVISYALATSGVFGASTVTTTVTSGASTTTVTAPAVTSTVVSTVSGGPASLGTVAIGVLTDLSDGLATEGVRVQAAAQLAVSDINAWVQNTSWAGRVTFTLSVQDYALNNQKALSELGTFASQGISVVVGPLNSGTAQALLSTADQDHIVMISPSSTSPALAIPNDYLFRTAPTDVWQGRADARIMWDSGVKAAIIVFRQDTYGSLLANNTAARFKQLGGTVVDMIPYDTSTTNFVPTLQRMFSDWQSASSQYGANNVAIYLVSFEEIEQMLQQAQSSYPQLLQTPKPWFGTDGQADSIPLNGTVGTLMAQIRLPSTIFGYTNSSKTQNVCARMLSQFKQPCDSYGLGAYDDTWLAALSILWCGKNDGTCVQKVLPQVAATYFGVTGWTRLDSAGDRFGGDFIVWCVQNTSSGPQWVLCGDWSQISDTVTWYVKPSGI